MTNEIRKMKKMQDARCKMQDKNFNLFHFKSSIIMNGGDMQHHVYANVLLQVFCVVQ